MRNFPLGSEVKAFVALGLNKKPRWTKAIYLENNTVEFNNSEVKSLKDSEIKLVVRLEYTNHEWPALNEFASKNWDTLKETVKTSMAKFFSEKEYEFDDKEHTVSCEGFYIGPAVVEHETYDSFIERPVWQLSVEEGYSGSLWEPPGADVVDLGCSHNDIIISRYLIDNLWKVQGDCYWENLNYDRMAEEYNRERED